MFSQFSQISATWRTEKLRSCAGHTKGSHR